MNEQLRLTHEEAVELAAPFVLGALDPDETAAVREHLQSCALPHEEFLELGSVVPALAEAVEQVEPPAALKGRILAAAAAELEARNASARPTVAPPPATEPPVPAAAPVVVAPRRRNPILAWGLAAAAVVAIVALVGSNLLLLNRLDASEAYARDVTAVLEAGAQPGALTAVLAPAEPGGPRGIAAVGADGRLTLAMQDLAPTAGDQVYEGWVIVGDAAPVPLGGFQVGAGGTGRLDSANLPVEPGMVLALTLEPRAGAQSPTLPILAVGAAGSPPAPEGAVGTAVARSTMSLAERPQPGFASVAP